MIRNALDGMKAKSSFLNPFRASTETIRATLARYVENFRNGEYNLKFRKKKQKRLPGSGEDIAEKTSEDSVETSAVSGGSEGLSAKKDPEQKKQ